MSGTLDFRVSPGGTLRGSIRVPGDKSISHRGVILGAIARGKSELAGFLEGDDTLATIDALRSLGVSIDGPDNGRVIIHGVGKRGLSRPAGPLYLANSGTSMRLLAGLLAGQPFDTVLTGDPSLSRRPMRRITLPLSAMGADVRATGSGTPPLRIRGGCVLRGIDYAMPVASAQVKSCLMLAGLFAAGKTCIKEPAPSRDHTERMLSGFGYDVAVCSEQVCLSGGGSLQGRSLEVPGDLSSATFFLVGASIAEGADLVIENVGLNPTRTGAIDILRLMGADIEPIRARTTGGEPAADVRVKSARLTGVHVPPALVPLAIDEFPALFIAAACARGETVVSGAAELRVKESDRIAVMAEGLARLGVDVQPMPDGMAIRGGPLKGGTVASHGDHRVAMAFAMSALCSQAEVLVEDCRNVNTSFPGFVALARSAGLGIDVREHGP